MKRGSYAKLVLLSACVIVSILASACAGPTGPSTSASPTAGAEPTKPATDPTAMPADPTAVPTEPAAGGDGTVKISFTQEPDSLNPLYTTMYFSAILRDFYLLGLWNFDENNEPVMELAAELPTPENGDISADGLTFTIKLREDAKWSDGEPVTADDFVFTYDMIMSDKNTVSSTYPYDKFVKSVTAKDEHTLELVFSEPFAAWQTSIFTYVLPKHTLEPVFEADGTLDNAAWNINPNPGVGPFMVKEWVSGANITFVPNPNHWAQPKLAQIFVMIVPDDAAQIAAIKSGDAHIGVFLSPADVVDLQKLGTVDTPTVGSGYNEGLFFNISPERGHIALQDVNVRRAIAMAINRQQITDDLLFGLTQPAITFWDTTPPFADPSIKDIPFDPEGAKALLDEAGWKDENGDGVREKDGVDLKLRYITNTRDLRKSVQAVVKQMLQDVGIDVELVNHSSDVFWNSYGEGGPQALGEYDLAEYSTSPSFPDPNSSLWLCSEIPSDDNPEGGNWQYFCNEELDAALTAQSKEIDPTKRLELFKEIEKIMADEVIWLGVWRDPDIWSVHKTLHGVKFSGATPFWNVLDWNVVK